MSAAGSRAGRIRRSLTRAEWSRVGAMAAVVLGLHVVGFGLLFAVVVPAHLSLGAAGAFTAGVGLTAYTLGLRHALDADHIAAIDKTTRKLMADGQRIALLFLAGGAAGAGLPWYAVLTLPVLFAAGMSLLDTVDGSFMNLAYGWALSNPVRRLYYNATVTGLSVVVALGIGGVELTAVLAERFGFEGGVWDLAGGVDLSLVGYAIVALFAITWAVAVVVWRVARIEERWALPAERA